MERPHARSGSPPHSVPARGGTRALRALFPPPATARLGAKAREHARAESSYGRSRRHRVDPASRRLLHGDELTDDFAEPAGGEAVRFGHGVVRPVAREQVLSVAEVAIR